MPEKIRVRAREEKSVERSFQRKREVHGKDILGFCVCVI